MTSFLINIMFRHVSVLLIVFLSLFFISCSNRSENDLEKEIKVMLDVEICQKTILQEIDIHQELIGGKFKDKNVAFTLALHDANKNGAYNEIGIDRIIIGDYNTDSLYVMRDNVSAKAIQERTIIEAKGLKYEMTEINADDGYLVMKCIDEDVVQPTVRLFSRLPDIQFETVSGNFKNFREFTGKDKYIFVQFWTASTGYEESISKYVDFIRNNQGRLHVICLSNNNYPEDFEKYIKDFDVTWTCGISTNEVFESFVGNSTNFGVIFDAEGNLIETGLHPWNLEEYFKSNIKEMSTDFIIYIVKAAVALTFLYLLFWIFLRKDTFYIHNRFYLLGSLVASLILPMIDFSGVVQSDSEIYTYLLDTIVIQPENVRSAIANQPALWQVLSIIYLTGVGIFFVQFAYRSAQLLWLISKFGIRKLDGIKVVFTDRNYAPFTFLNIVFLNNNLHASDVEKIIAHEQIHVKQHHSIDLMILEFMRIFQWFNPVVWFYRNSLKGIHEFLADQGVLSMGIDRKAYQELLLSQAIGAKVFGLTNNFNQSLLKRRFIMMTKIKSTRISKFKVLLAVPLVISIALAFTVFESCSKETDKNNYKTDRVKYEVDRENAKTVNSSETDNAKTIHDFSDVDQKPLFTGGDNALLDFLSTQTKYPEEARKNGIQGKVFIKFAIDIDGSVTNVEVTKSVDPILDKEALRVVKSMPKWSPGKNEGKAVKVSYQIPLNFKLH